jgi:hypothetical protein
VVPSIFNLLFKLFALFLVISERGFVVVDELLRLCNLFFIIILFLLSLLLELLMLFHLLLELGFLSFSCLQVLIYCQLSILVSCILLLFVLLNSFLNMRLLLRLRFLCLFQIICHFLRFLGFFILCLLKMSFNFSFFFLQFFHIGVFFSMRIF